MFQLIGRLPPADMRASRSFSSSVKPFRLPARMHSSVVPGTSRTEAASAISSSKWAPRGHGIAGGVVVGGRSGRRKAQSAGRARFGDDARHRRDLLRARLLVAAVAHDDSPYRRVSDEEPGVHSDRTVEMTCPVLVCRPIPREAGFEGLERHALDACHHPHEVPGVVATRGASVNPQFPPRTVVTPWRGEGLAVGSHDSCAS